MSARAAALALALVACAAPQPAPGPTPSSLTLPYDLPGGGRVELVVAPAYDVASPVRVEVVVRAGTSAVRGPRSGRILFTTLGGEQVVRLLPAEALGSVDVPPGGSARTAVVWDGRDDAGAAVPAETYSLAIEFESGGTTVLATTVVQLEQR
ncbi:MAG TPA: hypothetical protein VMJ92_00675 [Candidatus Limnocylindrales bacterium]|nr:hypothetical protein [Candidatus Limnocylindrales bacterium]